MLWYSCSSVKWGKVHFRFHNLGSDNVRWESRFQNRATEHAGIDPIYKYYNNSSLKSLDVPRPTLPAEPFGSRRYQQWFTATGMVTALFFTGFRVQLMHCVHEVSCSLDNQSAKLKCSTMCPKMFKDWTSWFLGCYSSQRQPNVVQHFHNRHCLRAWDNSQKVTELSENPVYTANVACL